MSRMRKGDAGSTATAALRQGPTLRTTLLEVALAELERVEHPSAVTIAAIVNKAGCTPPSLYHYWPTREELLREAAALGWSRFEASQATAAEDPRPRARIRARGQAYLRFAREQPGLFRVLFLVPMAEPPVAGEATERGPAFWALRDDVSAAITIGEADPGQLGATELAMTLWCAIHGLASLALADPTGPGTHMGMVATIDEAILGPDPATSRAPSG